MTRDARRLKMPEAEARHAMADDLAEIARINNQAAEWVGARDAAFFERFLDLPLFLVAGPCGRLDGFILVMDKRVDYDSPNFRWFRERYARFFYIDRVVIDASSKRRGLGRMFYDRVRAATRPAPLVCEVCIEPENSESVRFHDRYGFVEVGLFRHSGHAYRMYELGAGNEGRVRK